MSQTVTLELPDDLVRRVRAEASQTSRAFEAVLVDWLDRSVRESSLDDLPNEDLLALCEGQIDESDQSELSELLARNQDGPLAEGDRKRLDELMRLYRRGLVCKARAWSVAVTRGLKPKLS